MDYGRRAGWGQRAQRAGLVGPAPAIAGILAGNLEVAEGGVPIKELEPARNAARRKAMPAHLRVYPSPDDSPSPRPPQRNVRVSLADLLPLVALAHRKNYAWLQDFLDDEVRISEDLYEVLQAFRVYRPSA